MWFGHDGEPSVNVFTNGHNWRHCKNATRHSEKVEMQKPFEFGYNGEHARLFTRKLAKNS